MQRTLAFAAIVAAISLQGGCGTSSMYAWGHYDEALYAHYKHPQQRDEFVADLKKVVDEAEAKGVKAPPGCYAEYGYALLEEGRRADAAAFFKKERKTWPESRAFMDRMIALAERPPAERTKAASAQEQPAVGQAKAPPAQNQPSVEPAKVPPGPTAPEVKSP